MSTVSHGNSKLHRWKAGPTSGKSHKNCDIIVLKTLFEQRRVTRFNATQGKQKERINLQ